MAKAAKKVAKKAPANKAPAKKVAKKAPSANKPMTKTEVYAYLADKVGITKQQARSFFDEQAELAYNQAKKNDKGFTVPGIGKLVVVKRGPRTFRNPQTGEPVKKPASKALKFRIAKPAKDAVLPAGK
jgi:DNA-binding protein HU-beta